MYNKGEYRNIHIASYKWVRIVWQTWIKKIKPSIWKTRDNKAPILKSVAKRLIKLTVTRSTYTAARLVIVQHWNRAYSPYASVIGGLALYTVIRQNGKQKLRETPADVAIWDDSVPASPTKNDTRNNYAHWSVLIKMNQWKLSVSW